MISFEQYLNKMKPKIDIDVSLENYEDKLKNSIHDNLFDESRRMRFILEFVLEYYDLKRNLEILNYPKSEKLIDSVLYKNPEKIRIQHDCFVEWAGNDFSDARKKIDISLLEIRQLLKGKKLSCDECKNNSLFENIYKSSSERAEKIKTILMGHFEKTNHKKAFVEGKIAPDLYLEESAVFVGGEHVFNIDYRGNINEKL